MLPVLLIRICIFKNSDSLKEFLRIYLAETGQACHVTDN